MANLNNGVTKIFVTEVRPYGVDILNSEIYYAPPLGQGH